MSRSQVAALAAASSVVGAGVATWAAREILRRQAAEARRRIGKPLGEDAPDADRVWRPSYEGRPLELLLVGDSIAAGLGAARRKETLGARIAKGIARRLQQPVRLRTVAVVGSESSGLAAQLDRIPNGYRPDVAVIVVGGNDVTHRIPVGDAAAHLGTAIERMRGLGAGVVVATCPDLGALRAVPQPLRSLASRLSRQLAAAQAKTAVEAGAHVVSLGSAVGPMFLSQPDEMFSLDRFHPSALGYKHTAAALLPAVIAAARGETPAASHALAAGAEPDAETKDSHAASATA